MFDQAIQPITMPTADGSQPQTATAGAMITPDMPPASDPSTSSVMSDASAIAGMSSGLPSNDNNQASAAVPNMDTSNVLNSFADPMNPASSSPVSSVSDTSAASVDPLASSASVFATPTSAVPAGNEDLIAIKQEVLSSLSPLVDHLDQSPEEKFRTTMMMIQASDDQTLVRAAYEAAKQITDEKARAQALLDIVNEINYFTSHHAA